MKKFVMCLMAAALSLTFVPFQAIASGTEEPIVLEVTKPMESTESELARKLELRLEEISATDMSTLKLSEKKELRKEVRSIKRELKDISGGVYISAGLLILILVLLIVLV